VYYNTPSPNEPNDVDCTGMPIYINTNGGVQYNWCRGNQQIEYNDTPVSAAEMTTAAGAAPVLEIARWGMHRAFSGITFDNGTFTFDQITTAATNHSVLV
jgi:hypothetical protein